MINVNELTDAQERKLRKTIIKLNNFKKRQKKKGQSPLLLQESITHSTFEKAASKGTLAKQKQDLNSDMDHLLSCDTLENGEIFRATGKNLSTTHSLSFLQFCAVRLSKRSWKALSDGIAQNNTVKILSLNACCVNNVAFEQLVPALNKNTSLEILDLSYNYMGDDMACYISKIISNECERQDNVVWLAGLRGEKPGDDPRTSNKSSVLYSIVLRHNDFKNYICSELSRVLLYDIYLRSVDLRNNNIEESGVKYMTECMKTNKTLLNCDLRQNEGFTASLHRKIAISLLNNLRIAKQNPKIEVQKWINPELLTIEVPENMVPMIQEKLNALVESPYDITPSKLTNRNESRLNDRPKTVPTNLRKGRNKKVKGKKVEKGRVSKLIREQNAIYQIASDSNKKTAKSQLDYYKEINNHLAQENQLLIQKLSRYEAPLQMDPQVVNQRVAQKHEEQKVAELNESGL